MKGVNKLVMEIRPESEYFDKAILFLKPDKTDHTQNEISSGAEKLLNESFRAYNNKSTEPSPVWLLLAGITAGSLISWACVFIIGLI